VGCTIDDCASSGYRPDLPQLLIQDALRCLSAAASDCVREGQPPTWSGSPGWWLHREEEARGGAQVVAATW